MVWFANDGVITEFEAKPSPIISTADPTVATVGERMIDGTTMNSVELLLS